MLYADSGAGKTFVVLSWCFCIAGGILWLGRKLKQGPVVYVAAEGVGGLAKRLRALMAESGLDEPPPDLYVIEQSVNLLSPFSMGEAIAAAEEIGVRPVLVVFDTYRAVHGRRRRELGKGRESGREGDRQLQVAPAYQRPGGPPHHQDRKWRPGVRSIDRSGGYQDFCRRRSEQSAAGH